MILPPVRCLVFTIRHPIKKISLPAQPHFFSPLLLYSNETNKYTNIESAKNGLNHTSARLRSYIFMFLILEVEVLPAFWNILLLLCFFYYLFCYLFCCFRLLSWLHNRCYLWQHTAQNGGTVPHILETLR